MHTRNPLAFSGSPLNATAIIDTILVPQVLTDAIGADDLLGLYTPSDETNTCFCNWLHCRYNQMFQCPFCFFWPVAALGCVVCVPYELCAANARWFTQKNRGSILAVTDHKIIKYTPTLSQGSCCFKTAYPEKAFPIPWEDIVEIQRAPIIDTRCGNQAVIELFAVCCIMPCFTIWNRSCSCSELCGFEDSNVRVSFTSATAAGAAANGVASYIDYGPDFRAPEIRNKLKDLLARNNTN